MNEVVVEVGTPFGFMSYEGKCWQCRFRLNISGFCTKLNRPVPRYGWCELFEKLKKEVEKDV
jgi:hypothetical protein